MRKTKIICTVGPAVDSDKSMSSLMKSGMDCARFNFSHGTHEEHKIRMDRIKRLRNELNLHIPILLDTKGPEIRIRTFKNGSVQLKRGQAFTLSPDYNLVGDENIVGLTFKNLAKYVSEDTVILIDDGKVMLEVVKINKELVECMVMNDGELKNRKSINIPDTNIDMPYISPVDKADILFGIEQDVDFIAASFVRCADDVKKVRKLLKDNGGEQIKIISKIENTQGLKNIDEIINVSDGIMIARGDMGVEIPFKRLPPIQKELIEKCYHKGKFVITATQMLESMTSNPRPTRAEVSDVANAVYDGSTAIMLSGESAAGKYPIKACQTMAEIAEAAEETINYDKRFHKNALFLEKDMINAVASSVCSCAFQLNAKAILATTRTGLTPISVANYRPGCPIIAVSLNEKCARQLNLMWNVHPVMAEFKNSTDEIFAEAIEKALETKIVKKGDTVVITGSSVLINTHTDMMKIHKI